MTPSRSLLLGACTLIFGLSGCGLFYDNSYQGTRFRMYSDRNAEFVADVAERVEQIYTGYQRLFDLGPSELGRTTIILEGDEETPEEQLPAADVLGYYVPLFNYISVDTRSSERSGNLLQQVLLHEVAHHFIVTEFPQASRRCWLNEGLAGNLEVTLFHQDHFEYPLVNPSLFYLAQKVAYERRDEPILGRLLDMNWNAFHDDDTKELNYALAWSVVFFLLERYLPQDASLGDRFEALYRLEREDITALEGKWLSFLRGFDMAGYLLAIASRQTLESRLTSRWAVLQLSGCRSGGLRVLTGLVDLFEDPDEEKRFLSYLVFLKALERDPHSFFLNETRVQKGLEHISRVLNDPSQPLAVRRSLEEVVAYGGAPSAAEGVEDGGEQDAGGGRFRSLLRWSAGPAAVAR